MPQGLPRKLRYVFVLQAVTASFAIVIGFYLVGMLVKDVLTSERVQAEADSYWAAHARDPGQPPPRTLAMSAYFVPTGESAAGHDVPAAFISRPVGLYDLPDGGKLLVDERPQGRLYIAMSFPLEERMVLWIGVVAAAMALLAIYAVSWLSYQRSKRLVVPVNWLAHEVSRWDPAAPDIATISHERIPANAGSEVWQLADALRGLELRTQAFVQRERDFTRDASHELRTPLTVIRVATDMMRSDPDTPERLRRPLQRVQRAGQDMEAVIDAFLILARESELSPDLDEFEVREIVWEVVEKMRPLLADKPVELVVVEDASPRLATSPRVLAVMLDNLLSNACMFTERGRIEVRLGTDRIVVRDTGIGMSAETLQRVYDPFYRADQFGPGGKGMGLSIVRRLGERFGWPVTLESAPGEGTTATIRFSDASMQAG